MIANYYRFLIARLAIVRDLHALGQAILDDDNLTAAEKFDLEVLIGVKLDRHNYQPPAKTRHLTPHLAVGHPAENPAPHPGPLPIARRLATRRGSLASAATH